MKNYISLVLITIFLAGCKTKKNITTVDNSKISLDWNGNYYGTLPCENCQGIQTMITLKENNTYIYKTRHLDKEVAKIKTKRGDFSWDENGGKITLKGIGENSVYLVAENRLFQLNAEGKRYQGDLANKYVLEKQDNRITNKYWKLTELLGKPVKTENDQREIHFILKEQDSRIGGFSGSNNFNGSYELLPNNRLSFNKIATTMKACNDMTQESDFLNVLKRADNYTVNGDTLHLNRARMAPLAKFEAVYFN